MSLLLSLAASRSLVQHEISWIKRHLKLSTSCLKFDKSCPLYSHIFHLAYSSAACKLSQSLYLYARKMEASGQKKNYFSPKLSSRISDTSVLRCLLKNPSCFSVKNVGLDYLLYKLAHSPLTIANLNPDSTLPECISLTFFTISGSNLEGKLTSLDALLPRLGPGAGIDKARRSSSEWATASVTRLQRFGTV